MRNTVKFLILYALWYGYNVCGYAQFTMQVVDKAAEAAIVHTYQITGLAEPVYNLHVFFGTIYT
jgi:hypothetical protein